MRYMVFRKDLDELKESADDVVAKTDEKYKIETFKPDWFCITPKGMNKNLAFVIYWLLYLIIWRRQGKSYEHYLVYDRERLIHRCTVLPKYYRYPFMGNNDIQIGPYWTADGYRGQGICPIMICKIMNKYKFKKKYAYVVMRENNTRSQRCVIKAGLNFYGYSIRTKGFFGRFLLQTEMER